MKIEVFRQPSDDVCTLGELVINGTHECYTLEDVVRPDGEKVFGKTAIPYGTYLVVATFSQHFQRDLPLLVNVPNFSGVRIHPGNTAADTEGCVIVGKLRGVASVGKSVDAFSSLYAKIMTAWTKRELITIKIG
jgi:hypothetical protein